MARPTAAEAAIDIPPQYQPGETDFATLGAAVPAAFAPVAAFSPAPDAETPQATAPVADAAAAAHDDDYDIHGNHAAVGGADEAAAARRDLSDRLHTMARVDGDEPNALTSIIKNDPRAGEGGNKGGESREKKERDQAYRTTMQMIQDQIARLDRQIEELGRRADAIEDYLDGPIEVGADGRLTNEAMERELAEYERRTGQRIDRNNEEAVRQALRDQQDFILRQQGELIQERERAQDFANRVEASGQTPSVEEMRQIIPDYTPDELDLGSNTLDAERVAVVDEARGYDVDLMEQATGRARVVPTDPAPAVTTGGIGPLSSLDGLTMPEEISVSGLEEGSEVALDSPSPVLTPVALGGLDELGGVSPPSPLISDTISVASQIDSESLSPVYLSNLFAEKVYGEENQQQPEKENTFIADNNSDNTISVTSKLV